MSVNQIKQHISEHQYDDARRLLIALETNQVVVWRGWIAAYEQGLVAGEAYCLKHLKHHPQNHDLWSLLGWVQWEQSYPHKAMASFHRSLQLQWSVDAYLNFVSLACEVGLYAEASAQVEAGERHLNVDEVTQEKLDAYLLCKAVLARQNGQSNEAIQLLNSIVSVSPEVYIIRGHTYRDEYLYTQSMMAYQQGLDEFPMHPVLFECFQQVLKLLPSIPNGVHRLLADQQDSVGAFLKVRSYLEKIKADLLDRDARSPEVKHLSAAIHGQNTPMPPNGYVEELFDDYSERFESHLVEKLSYQVPTLIKSVVSNRYTSTELATIIWDLGCGTGLLGPFLKSVSRCLIGVDISEKMLDRAKMKGVYDELFKADIVAFCNTTTLESPDLIVVADTLVYFGDLHPFFQAVSNQMNPSSELICTLETLEDETPEGYQLMPSGRYCHHILGVHHIVEQYGLAIVNHGDVLLRQGGGSWVNGMLLVIMKNSQC